MPSPAPPTEAIAHPSATLLLVRDGAAGIEVLMVARHAAAAFAGGALVFPGGRVDPADGDARVLAQCCGAGNVDPAAMAFRVAAIRESFEEAHLLLARRKGAPGPLAAAALGALEARLAAALGRAPCLADLLGTGTLELATDLLVPFAHWITPRARPKRFDTHFFLAPAPADQIAVQDGQEVVAANWVEPRQTVAAADAGRISLVFATRMNLLKLARSPDVAAALAAARREPIVTICPELFETPAGWRVRIPPDAGYGAVDMPAQGVIPP